MSTGTIVKCKRPSEPLLTGRLSCPACEWSRLLVRRFDMARSSDPKKAALWQRRFRRFFDSGLPVVRFCAVERVSESSFYYWQKKLRPLRRSRGMGAEDRAACCEGQRAITEARNVFRPVTVVPATCGVVVRLPGGARIEVAAGQLDTVRAVVAETVRADHDWTTQPNMSTERPVFQKRGDAQRC